MDKMYRKLKDPNGFWEIEYEEKPFYINKISKIYRGQEKVKDPMTNQIIQIVQVVVKVIFDRRVINYELDKLLTHLHYEETKFINRLRRVVQTKERQYCQVFEYCNKQTLEEMLGGNKSSITETSFITEVSHLSKFIFAYQLVRAIFVLENRKIIHNDISLRNILVDSAINQFQSNLRYYLLKVSDFGESILKDQNTNRIRITPNYSSPEKLDSFLKQSKNSEQPQVQTSSDVFSLGVILYKIFYGVHPFSKGLNSQIKDRVQYSAYYAKYLKEVKEPEKIEYKWIQTQPNPSLLHKHQKYFIEIVIPQMLAYDKKDRPKIQDVLKKLKFCFIEDTNEENIMKYFNKCMQQLTAVLKDKIWHFYVIGIETSPITGKLESIVQSIASDQYVSIREEDNTQFIKYLQESANSLRKSILLNQPGMLESKQKILSVIQQLSKCLEDNNQKKENQIKKQLVQISKQIILQISKVQLQVSDLKIIDILLNLFEIQVTKNIFLSDKTQKQEVSASSIQSVIKKKFGVDLSIKEQIVQGDQHKI